MSPRPRTAARAPVATAAKPAANGRRRRAYRPNGNAGPTAQALELVQQRPGITIPERADRMGINQNYLPRLPPGVESEGKVSEQGRGWRTASPAAEA